MDPNYTVYFSPNSTGPPFLPELPPDWPVLLKLVLCHVIVAVGLVANCLTLVVMKSPRLRYKSYSHYLSALAVFDSLVLAGQEVEMVNQILTERLGRPGVFDNVPDAACKFYKYADAVSNLMSSWLIVAMGIERVCVVYMPFRRNMWCQQKGAVIIILSLFFLLASSQSFMLLMVENQGPRCEVAAEHLDAYVALHVYFYQFALLFIAPVTIVLVCNIGVLLRIFSVEKATQNEDSSSTRLTGSARRRSKTTRMLVAVSLTYILTTMPLIVLTVTMHVIGKKYGFAARHHLRRAMPWFHILQVVANINYASNFFIYILSGKKFRIELGRIFTKDRRTNSFAGGSSRTRDEIIMM